MAFDSFDARRILRAFCGSVHYQGMTHISDHDLERFQLGVVKDEAELSMIEGHLLTCSQCVEAAYQAVQYVDTIRAGIPPCQYS